MSIDNYEEILRAVKSDMRANPTVEPDDRAREVIQQLMAQGVDPMSLDEDEWRGLAYEMGLEDDEAEAWLEDLASWLEPPV